MRGAWIVLIVAGALAALGGCNRNADQLCEDFVSECGENNEVRSCQIRASALESQAAENGCIDRFLAYVDCVDDLSSLCETAKSCASERQSLADCGVFFGSFEL